MGDNDELEMQLKKLVVRLKNLQVGKQLDTLVQIIKDLQHLSESGGCEELFEDNEVHLPLMVVLKSYIDSHSVQKAGLALLCRLIEICPSTMNKLAVPVTLGNDWDVLGIHQQVLTVLSLHREQYQVMTVGLKTLAHLLKSDAIVLMVLEDEMDVFDLVVNAMKRFHTSEEIQLYGCCSLQLLLEQVPEEHLVEFMEKQDHSVVLRVARDFGDRENVVLQTLRVLHPLAGPASNVEIMMSGNERCYDAISQAMLSFPHNEALQDVGCSLFQKFTSESYHNILVRNGVHRVILRACGMYPENAHLQASALSCLAALTKMIFLSKDLQDEMREHKERETDEGVGWFSECCRALQFHTASAPVQEAACWALNSLLVHDTQVHQALVDVDGRIPIHRQVMAAMLLHPSSPGLFHAAANMLTNLIHRHGKVRALLLSNGIHINVVEMMKRHVSSPEVSESACMLLHQLFQGRTASLDEVTVAMCEILRAMKEHGFQLQVQLQALKVSLTFLNPDRSLREHGVSVSDPDAADISLKVLKNQCVVEGAHTIYLQALNRFIGTLDIQEYGLRVLSALTDSSGAADLMCQQGAIDTTLHTLQMFPAEREAHYWGLNLLQHLISKKKVSRMTVPVLVSVLMKSLRQHQGDADVVLKGFQLAWKLLEMCPGAANELEKEDFDRVIFQQIKTCFLEQATDMLLRISLVCLSEMAADSDIGYAMLEKACEEGDVVMAECLIQLGADVNKKAKTESLIYQVCERGGPLELVDVLLLSGVHEQQLRSALNASVRRRDGRVLSLLLAKLGLDLSNSALCLGGFRLGHIEPDWLSPLFSERRLPNLGRRSSRGKLLARLMMTIQKRKSQMSTTRLTGDACLPGYVSDESDDSGLFLPDDSFVFASDVDSDGSEGTPTVRRKVQPNNFEEQSEQLAPWQQGRCQRPSVEGGHAEPDLHELRRQRFSKESQRSCGSPVPSVTDSPTLSGPTPLGRDRERIRLLDLSGNELDSVSCLMGDNAMLQHLEYLVRLDLGQNNLTQLPDLLCQSLKSITRLDLHGNRLQSLPPGLFSLPSLNMLNMSRNCVGPQLSLPPGVQSPSLRTLSLSHNHIAAFPSHLYQVVEKLEELLLDGNRIPELMSAMRLPELRVLDISENGVEHIATEALSGCPRLETVSASANKLSCLSSLPSKLTTVKLFDNCFTCIPEAILQLPYLRSLDMRSNNIAVLPGPPAWASVNLRELIFSRNHISVLDIQEPVSKWSRLEKLHLSNNLLLEIPSEIGLLESLMSLDVSRNEGLRAFPDEMGKLVRLWDLPLDGLRLSLNLKHIGSKTKDIIRFLQQRLKKVAPYFRMKLIVVGSPRSGKTTLLRQLMKLRSSHNDTGQLGWPTVGIDVRDWPVRDREKRNILLNVWDFAGGEEHSCHAHFMTQRAVYLVVYDLSKGAADMDTLKPWLFNIKAVAPLSPVILVGTHADVAEERHLQACIARIKSELLLHQGFPVIQDCHMVSASEDSESLRRLRKAIVKEAVAFKIQGQPVIGQLIPESYLELERRLMRERSRASPTFPVLLHQALLDIVQESQLQLDETELAHAVRFLSEAGVLLHFDDPALQLSDLYFIEPQWVCNIISQVLMLRNSGLSEQPIMLRSTMERFVLESSSFPKHYFTQYLKLLEKFQIALPFGGDQLLIPNSLPHHRPVIDLPHCENSEIVVRLYEMPYFPMGFWSRLITCLLEASSSVLREKAKALRPNRIYWRTGIYLSWSPEAYCLVQASTVENSPESFVKVTVPCSRKGHIVLGRVLDYIDSVLEEWFPVLLTTDIHGHGEMLLKKWALYSFEDGQEWKRILMEELFAYMKEDLLVNPSDPKATVPISQIAPDLILRDLPASMLLNTEELKMDTSKPYLLGDGGFGSVYRAHYKDEEVAVKIFNKHASSMHIHRLLRQELAVLGRLLHPSLVSLLAAGTSPHLLVMELAPCGSLDLLFESESGSLNRKLQHRIALQVADGLRYLHTSMIIYRDLKPHNVLLFNLKTNAEVIAKVTDYGIAQYCCSMGVRTSEGTPGFRAPEVARGNVIYNQQADVYSFGLLMFDLLTCGERISDGMKFPSEFDEIAVRGKLPELVKQYGCAPWPLFEELMRECLRERPQERPTSSQVFERLSSGEVLCLMREVPVCCVPSAECFAVSRSSDGPCISVGGGSSSQRRGCITSVELHSGKLTAQEIDSSPVLCLVTVQMREVACDWLVAGTQSGSLIIISTADMSVRHCLQRVTDAVTCLFFHIHPQHRKRHLLVGTADGILSVYEESEIQRDNGQPSKTVTVGNMNTPVVGLGRSRHSADTATIWAGCGTQVLSLTADYDIRRTIETKTIYKNECQLRCSGEANISRLGVDKHLYLSKVGGHTVEVWDKKSEKMHDLIDCTQILRESFSRNLSTEQGQETGFSWASVKALLVQHSSALWIGTRWGHVILVDLSTCLPLQVLTHHCQSVRSLSTAHIEAVSPRNVVLVLGRSEKMCKEQLRAGYGEDSVLQVWNSSLPQEIRDLQQHCDIRARMAIKMNVSQCV